MYQRETILSGAMLEVIKTLPIERPKGRRMKTGKGTSEDQRKRNQQQKQKDLARLIARNFKNGDHYLTLTFREMPDEEEAKKAMAKFFRKLRKKYGEEAKKYIYVREYGRGRIHFHMLMPQEISLLDIIESWKAFGKVVDEPLYSAPDFHNLAAYLLKEEKKNSEKAYITGKAVLKPERKVESISAKSFRKVPPESLTVKGKVYKRNDWEEHADPFTMDTVQTAVYFWYGETKKKERSQRNGKEKGRRAKPDSI